MNLYREEKEHALKDGVLSKVFLALSRETDVPKVSLGVMLTAVPVPELHYPMEFTIMSNGKCNI